MKSAAVLLLAALLSPSTLALQVPPPDGFALHMLTDSKAVCLDGSQGGFYYRPGSNSSFGDEFGENTWIIEIEGGGWCNSTIDCLARSKGPVGTSKYWPAHGIPGMDGGANGMLS